jgi:hypothetical protein
LTPYRPTLYVGCMDVDDTFDTLEEWQAAVWPTSRLAETDFVTMEAVADLVTAYSPSPVAQYRGETIEMKSAKAETLAEIREEFSRHEIVIVMNIVTRGDGWLVQYATPDPRLFPLEYRGWIIQSTVLQDMDMMTCYFPKGKNHDSHFCGTFDDARRAIDEIEDVK